MTDHSEEKAVRDQQVVLAIVLVGAARADGVVHKEELQQIVKLIQRSFYLPDHDVGELINIAEIMLLDAVKAEQFVTRIVSQMAKESLIALLEKAWSVVIAHPWSVTGAEEQFIKLFGKSFNLNDEEIELARKKAFSLKDL